MKKVLLIGGIFLTIAGITAIVVYKVRSTVTEKDATTNRKKWKKYRKITIKRAVPKMKIK